MNKDKPNTFSEAGNEAGPGPTSPRPVSHLLLLSLLLTEAEATPSSRCPFPFFLPPTLSLPVSPTPAPPYAPLPTIAPQMGAVSPSQTFLMGAVSPHPQTFLAPGLLSPSFSDVA